MVDNCQVDPERDGAEADVRAGESDLERLSLVIPT